MKAKLLLDFTSEIVREAHAEFIAAVTGTEQANQRQLIGHIKPIFARPAAKSGQGKSTRMSLTINRFRKMRGK